MEYIKPIQPQLNLRENLRSYASLFLRSLKASFAYRASTVTSVIGTTFIYAIPLLVWRHVYAQNSGTLAVPKAQMFPYLLVACCVNYGLSMNIENRIGQRIRLGLIATDLLKPVDFQLSQALQCVSDGIFNGALGIVVFIVGFFLLGPEVFPKGFLAFGLFLVSFLLAFLVMYCICFVFVQGAFYTYSGYGIFASRGALHQTFSGMSAPLILYPPFLKTIGFWLPFRHAIDTPVSIYLGWKTGMEAIHLILLQAAWVVGLFLLGRLLMKYALRQMEVQGG